MIANMSSGLKIARLFGIDIRINWSWIVIFVLVTWDLAVGVFPLLHPDWNFALRWGLGLAASLLFFGSVLAHELAHSLVAKSRGLNVSEITLFLFGGVSNLEEEPPTAETEFLMAVVGPLTSIVLGFLFIGLAGASAGTFASLTGNLESLARLGPLATLFVWLGPINIILGLFNLLPGFPLDGGRVFRSFLWAITGNLQQATKYASWVGQGFGWLFIFMGVSMVFGVNFPFFGTGIFSGLWLAFIGWFLIEIAREGYEQVMIEDVLKNTTVAVMMKTDIPSVGPETTVETLVHEHILGTEQRAWPVVTNQHLAGLVCLDDVRKISKDDWPRVTVNEIMTPLSQLRTVSPQKKASEALKIIASEDINQLPVLDQGKFLGLISRRDILLWLQVHSKDQQELREPKE